MDTEKYLLREMNSKFQASILMMMLRYIVFLILIKTSLNCGFGARINCCFPPFFLWLLTKKRVHF